MPSTVSSKPDLRWWSRTKQQIASLWDGAPPNRGRTERQGSGTPTEAVRGINPVPRQVNWRFHRAVLIVLLQENLCDVACVALIESLSSSTREFLDDSLHFAWVYNACVRQGTVRLRMFGDMLRSTRMLSQRARWAKLKYIEQVAAPRARIDIAHHANPRVSRTAYAIRELWRTPCFHVLDALHLFPHIKFEGKIYGMLCDLAVLSDPRLARVLSIKRMSAMTSIITDSVDTILAAKSQIAELGLAPRGMTFSFIAAGTAADAGPGSNGGHRHLHRPDLSSEPGFLGYANDLFELRPEHEFLREKVFYNLFGCFCVFETEAQSQAAWERAELDGKIVGKHVCFLALDTYDKVDLTETQDGG
eukprot:g2065.t1